jgi:hypothetical protein
MVAIVSRSQLIKDSVPVQFDHEPFVMLTSMASVLFTDFWDQSWCREPGDLQKVTVSSPHLLIWTTA